MTSYTFVTNTLHVCIVVLNSLGFFFVVFGAATTVLPFFKKPPLQTRREVSHVKMLWDFSIKSSSIS